MGVWPEHWHGSSLHPVGLENFRAGCFVFFVQQAYLHVNGCSLQT